MQDKDLERIIKEKVDKTEMREFTQVWEEIRGEITPPVKEKRGWRKKLSLIISSALIVVCLAFSPIIINSLNPPSDEELYFIDALVSQNVSKDDMFVGLQEAGLSHPDLSEYTFMDCILLRAKGSKIKGAQFIFYNEINMEFIATLKLYDKKVKLNLANENLYDSVVEVKETSFHYKYNGENGGTYMYDIYGVYNGTQYVIEYSGFNDSIVEFLTEIFA
ncbi:MAG: hypothetical protein IJW43_03500 [Clostridia bacterium]|nr:hypothetical protein [Clostridia bacterium]